MHLNIIFLIFLLLISAHAKNILIYNSVFAYNLAHLIDFPCIPIMPAVRFTNTMDIFGQPSLLGYIQHSGSKMAPDAGFLDRLNDVYRNFLFDLNTDSIGYHQQKVFEKAVGKPLPSSKDLVKQSPIYITNSKPYLDFAVPTTATIVQVGGITVDLNKPKTALPEDYEKILQERESMVLISFGSVIRSFQMPDNFKAGIIKMFETLPDVTFIWKYEKDNPYKADMLARRRGAIAFSKYDLKNPEKLNSAVRSLVYDLKYKNNAQTLLDVLSNQPIDPKQNLMKNLEFAMKFPNLRSQVPAINQVGTIAHYYLDVVAFLTILAGFSLYVLYSLLLKIIRRVVSKKF
ncbi:Protein CBG08858 [Caenorhabditis briggsae]|uniref:glucuronosyltransferase n=1 Tax=Caenorhabditis briggsae TaxID=6238 RepID=A8X7K1_CAEBR|nr:Protein CBG08858 [Caenorhabditis briggsae]CAP28612.1 Protein CBG08858 [Caenorhabditis briggsae]